jgi:hypothetical protein
MLCRRPERQRRPRLVGWAHAVDLGQSEKAGKEVDKARLICLTTTIVVLAQVFATNAFAAIGRW